jgi:hypothetical protein
MEAKAAASCFGSSTFSRTLCVRLETPSCTADMSYAISLACDIERCRLELITTNCQQRFFVKYKTIENVTDCVWYYLFFSHRKFLCSSFRIVPVARITFFTVLHAQTDQTMPPGPWFGSSFGFRCAPGDWCYYAKTHPFARS